MEPATTPDLNEALAGLLRKYAVDVAEPWRLGGDQSAEGVSADGLTLLSGCCADADLSQQTIPLRSWRSERRFQELKNLVENRTVTPVLMCRFACITDGQTLPLAAALYREFDLAEWLGGAPIATVYAAIDGERAANAIVRLENDVVCSVEVGTTLPAGTPMHDRHELIARRGVASDRVVDTQVPQSSVYVWSDSSADEFTDTDAELPELEPDSVALVRAAYDALSRPEGREELRREHERLRRLVTLAYESDRQRKRLSVEGRPS
jgi:hypothetical protein